MSATNPSSTQKPAIVDLKSRPTVVESWTFAGGTGMKAVLLLVVGLALAPVALVAQERPTLVVNVFTIAPDVVWPYDMKQMHVQMVAELKVMLGKQFDVVAEPPTAAKGNVYALDAEIVSWRAGNTAKRILVGFGSGREAADTAYRVTDNNGKRVLEKKDTIRTQFYSQMAGSTGTLAHPFADKMAERIRDANLR
jgi:hypothetical protein